jgi:hypothetical protein
MQQAIRKVLIMRRFATMLQSKPNVKQDNHLQPIDQASPVSAKADCANETVRRVHCERPIDYFIVFGVHPPKEFEDVDFGELIV